MGTLDTFNKWQYVENRDNNGTVSALFNLKVLDKQIDKQVDDEKDDLKGDDAVYAPQYAATPNKRQFDSAMDGVAFIKQYGLEVIPSAKNPKSYGGMSTKSFGASSITISSRKYDEDDDSKQQIMEMHSINENAYDASDEYNNYKHDNMNYDI